MKRRAHDKTGVRQTEYMTHDRIAHKLNMYMAHDGRARDQPGAERPEYVTNERSEQQHMTHDRITGWLVGTCDSHLWIHGEIKKQRPERSLH
jgi:hypothetical protein